MLFFNIKDPNPRFPQTPNGCALACAAMGLRLRGFNAAAVYNDLRRVLLPPGKLGVSFPDLARTLQKRYRIGAQAGRNHDLHAVLDHVRNHALVLGVDPSRLYSGIAPGTRHAVYVSGAEVPAVRLPPVTPAWAPTLRFSPAPEIIDPEPITPERSRLSTEQLALAFTGEFLLIPLAVVNARG